MKHLVCAVLLVFGAPWAGVSQPSQASGAGPNKLALLIAIDKYKYPAAVSPLAGSVNDIEDMKALLIGKFDFQPANILVLKNEQATHAAIISAIQTHLIAKARPGDIVVLDYSGHGSLMTVRTGNKPNRLDETIVPYDSRDPQGKVFDIAGSELHEWLVQLAAKTHNITFILDSCHSGTLVRGARTRGIAADTRTAPLQAESPSGERGLHDVGSDPVPPFTLIAAATSKEVAFEHIFKGQERGALTCFLTQQLRIAPPKATWRDVMDAVIANVNAIYPPQHPQLEGAQSDQQIFGVAVALSESYVPASPLDRTRVGLSQGEASGMTAGSIFDIHRPGTKRFEAEKPIATAQVTSVAEFTSEARVLSGGPVPQASRAVERIHKYEKSRLRVYLYQEKSKTLQALSQALAALPQIEIVSVPEKSAPDINRACKCQLQVEETGGRISILRAGQKPSSADSVPAGSADAVPQLVEKLKAWAKWFNELSIRPALPGPDIQLKITVPQSSAKAGNVDATVSVGDRVSVEVTNNSSRDLYIAMLDFSTDSSITQIYPTVEGASEVLKPGFSISRNFSAFIPGKDSVDDTVKVFASTKPLDLKPLLQPPGTRDIHDDSDPPNDLLAEAVGISRGLRPDDAANGDASPPAAVSSPPAAVSSPGKAADWNVVEKTLRINPK
jgi:hypothetical protein